jgi:mannose-6-phosphate isomerase-like protein (cupin superfamily)
VKDEEIVAQLTSPERSASVMGANLATVGPGNIATCRSAPVFDRSPVTPKGDAVKGFVDDIEDLTEENEDFRRVLYTGKNLQLVLMSLKPGEEIGEEVHEDRDQFFRVEDGEGEILIDGKVSHIEDDFAMIVPAGARHNVRNTGDTPLKLYTLYAPPEHVDGTVHRTKAEADAAHEHFDGRTTE